MPIILILYINGEPVKACPITRVSGRPFLGTFAFVFASDDVAAAGLKHGPNPRKPFSKSPGPQRIAATAL